jgi:aryl-alcohol dehydrogenase-like predicted oxidoreductase
METRLFGRSGHHSSVAIFGAAAFWSVDQAEADTAMELILEHNVNHIDVAPSYGLAEERLRPWMERMRDRFFLGCKTQLRDRESAAAEMHRSLERLHVDYFDLYQIHAITNMSELDQVTRAGGALEAILSAREEGLTRLIGITGHGVDSPAIFLEALQRFDFDSVLFPINYIQYTNPAYRQNAQELLRLCRERNVGTMIIKSIARGAWGDEKQTSTTWYKPFSSAKKIQQSVNFVLSQDVTGLCTAGDTHLLPLVLDACERFTPLNLEGQDALIASGLEYDPLFA